MCVRAKKAYRVRAIVVALESSLAIQAAERGTSAMASVRVEFLFREDVAAILEINTCQRPCHGLIEFPRGGSGVAEAIGMHTSHEKETIVTLAARNGQTGILASDGLELAELDE